MPDETRAFLQRLGVAESALLWRDDIDQFRLHAARKLTVTHLDSDAITRYEDTQSQVKRVQLTALPCTIIIVHFTLLCLIELLLSIFKCIQYILETEKYTFTCKTTF